MIVFGNVTVSGLVGNLVNPALKPAQRQAPRKDHAAHVSLSSDALVKQRGLNQPRPIRPANPAKLSGDPPKGAQMSPNFTLGRTENPPSPPLSREERILEIPKPSAQLR